MSRTKLLIVVCTLLTMICTLVTGIICTNKVVDSEPVAESVIIETAVPTQAGAYFPENETRYILVDIGYNNLPGNNDEVVYVYADKYMLTMYLYTKSGGLTQIFYEDGSPMMYDEG